MHEKLISIHRIKASLHPVFFAKNEPLSLGHDKEIKEEKYKNIEERLQLVFFKNASLFDRIKNIKEVRISGFTPSDIYLKMDKGVS